MNITYISCASTAIALASIAAAGISPPPISAAAQAQTAAAAGPEVRGKRLFLTCQACHAISAKASPKVGPNLYRLAGRKAAAVPGFAYSPALRKSGLVWSDANLDRWLLKPSAVVPGTTMAIPGVVRAEDRKALIAYMKHASK